VKNCPIPRDDNHKPNGERDRVPMRQPAATPILHGDRKANAEAKEWQQGKRKRDVCGVNMDHVKANLTFWSLHRMDTSRCHFSIQSLAKT
jgi:hypothetical protein